MRDIIKTSNRCNILTNLLIVLLVLLADADHRFVHCLEDNSTSVTPTPKTTTTTTATTTTTTLTTISTNNENNNNNNTTVSASEPEATNGTDLLLSGEEFVDYTEAPLLLFDGLSNEPKNETTTPQAAAAAASSPPISENVPTTTTSGPLLDGSETFKPFNNTSDTISENNTDTETLTHDTSSSSSNADDEETGDEDEVTDPTARDQTTKPFEPPQNVSQYMDYIETLFHDLRHQITDLFEPHIPQLIRTSQMVQLSSPCSYDMLRMALALRQFEPWALRMIDSSGKVPEGIFEGSFTALGSYDECLNTLFESSSSTGDTRHTQPSASNNNNNNQQQQQQHSSPHQAPTGADSTLLPPTQGKYCLVNVSPFLPPKPPADKVEKMFQDEANRRNITKDDQFSRLSPMFYYMKFRIGVCIPSTCDQTDMESISTALSSSLRLNITIPDCRVKQLVPMTNQQLIGGLIFSTVLVAVLAATLIDWSRRKWDQLERHELNMIRSTNLTLIDGQQQQRQQNPLKPTNWWVGHKGRLGATKESFNQRLSKHWSWMSFSLLTNFKLYFKHTKVDQNCDSHGGGGGGNYHFRLGDHSSSELELNSSVGSDLSLVGRRKPEFNSLFESPNGQPNAGSISMPAPEHKQQQQQHHQQQQRQEQNQVIIKCLNGIRVLSLCWVIIANSYITLDPRATKRLVKTREAPKDFFFQLVVQASLAIETFFFLSGVLVSLSFARRLRPSTSDDNQVENSSHKHNSTGQRPVESARDDILVMENGIQVKQRHRQEHQQQRQHGQRLNSALKWIHFYVHRYVRMTPATMLVIAFSMYAYRYGDGPLWFEATHKSHQSCSKNWWRHLLHVANFIDTRQMCFIHYWYIAADMQLFLFAPIIIYLIYKYRRIGYSLLALIGASSIGYVFYTTYIRNLPPTLLFYNSDPESRREFGNIIMTKPLTHALPYIVGILIGQWLSQHQTNTRSSPGSGTTSGQVIRPRASTGFDSISRNNYGHLSWTTLFGSVATVVALVEVFLPYKWNNSHLPNRLMASLYAALFRFGWSLVLAYVVISCRHKRGKKCIRAEQRHWTRAMDGQPCVQLRCNHDVGASGGDLNLHQANHIDNDNTKVINLMDRINSINQHPQLLLQQQQQQRPHQMGDTTCATNGLDVDQVMCFCGSGGNLVNRLLSLDIFAHLSRISFVAYLIHLPLMSVFVSQTRGLFAFSHTLVIHLALGYLVMTLILSFILVHIIEFPFITFERYLFNQLLYKNSAPATTTTTTTTTTSKGLFHHHDTKGGTKQEHQQQPRYDARDRFTSFKTDSTHRQDRVSDDRSRQSNLDEPYHRSNRTIDHHDKSGDENVAVGTFVSERL